MDKQKSNAADIFSCEAMAMVGRSLVARIGDRRMAGRWESGCGPNQGGINSELNCMAMAMAVKHRFGRMAE